MEENKNNNITNQAKEQLKEKIKSGIKKKLLLILPYILAAILIFVLIAWFIELLDRLKFENILKWLDPFESELKIGNGVYKIDKFLGDYEYKLNADDYEEAVLFAALEKAHFDTTKFTDTTENKILFKLLQQGLDLTEYESEEELKCLPLFVKAATAAAYPDLGYTDGELKGKVKVYRIQEDESFKQLKYVDKAEFDEKVNADKNKTLELFTLDNEGQISIASKYEITNEFSYSWFITPEEVISENTSTSEEGVTGYLLPYGEMVSQYAVSLEFLQALLIKTKDIKFCTEVANKVLNDTTITIKIYDNKKEIITTSDQHVSGKMNCQYLYNVRMKYKDENNDAQTEDWVYDKYNREETYGYDRKYKSTNITSTPKLILGEASSIFFHYTKDCSKTDTNIQTGPFYTEGVEAPRSHDFISEGTIWVVHDTVEEGAKAEYINQKAIQGITDINDLETDFGAWGPINIYGCGKINRTYLTEKIDSTYTVSEIGIKYTENTPNITFKGEGAGGFYDTFIDPQYEETKNTIYEVDLSLFELMESSPKSAPFVPILKYIMFKESGRNYGVTDEDSLLNREEGEPNESNSGSVYVVKVDNADALPTLTKDQMIQAIEALPTMFYGARKTNALSILDDLKNTEQLYKVNATFALAVLYEESKVGTAWDLIDPSTNNWYSIKWYSGNSYAYYTDRNRNQMV